MKGYKYNTQQIIVIRILEIKNFKIFNWVSNISLIIIILLVSHVRFGLKSRNQLYLFQNVLLPNIYPIQY
jgi:hypothetical protein